MCRSRPPGPPLHVSPVVQDLPSSHCSPASRSPLPQKRRTPWNEPPSGNQGKCSRSVGGLVLMNQPVGARPVDGRSRRRSVEKSAGEDPTGMRRADQRERSRARVDGARAAGREGAGSRIEGRPALAELDVQLGRDKPPDAIDHKPVRSTSACAADASIDNRAAMVTTRGACISPPSTRLGYVRGSAVAATLRLSLRARQARSHVGLQANRQG